MSTVEEAKLSWLKTLGVPDATITTLSAKRGAGAPNRLNQPGQATPAEPVGGNADSVPDLINGDVVLADAKKPDGPEVPLGNPDKAEDDMRKKGQDAPKPDFPGGIPDKDEQDKRDNRNDSGAIKGKKVDVKKVLKKVRNVFKKDKKQTKQPPRGKALPLKLVLVSSGIKAASPEPQPGTAVEIEGEIPIGSNAKEDLDAVMKAIEKEEIKVSIGGVRAKVDLRNVEGYRPDKSRLAIKVWILTRIPSTERPGKDETVDAPVVVQIGDVSSDGKATIKVHYKPPPSKDAKPAAPTGF